MDRGYIKLHRQLLDWEWANDPNVMTVWIHLLLRAHWSSKPKKYRGVTLKRGQCIVGRKELAKATGLSEQNIRTVLCKLALTNNLTSKSTNKFTLITIGNYAFYQGGGDETNQQINQQPNQQLTSNQPQRKKGKKERKKESIYTHPAKEPYGIKGNVFLTFEEYLDIIGKFERPDELIDNVSLWLTEHERKDHHATCLTFARNDKWPKRTKPREIPSSVLDEQEQAAADKAREELMELIREKGIGAGGRN